MNYAIAKGHTFWSDETLSALKSKIKDHLRKKQEECCCYCSRNIDDEFNMVLDIEHIIPKSKITSEMFEMMNLAVSCKRCNMRIKREDVSFINDEFQHFKETGDYYRSGSYKFIHPNLESWDENLIYTVAQVNRKKWFIIRSFRIVLKEAMQKNTLSWIKYKQILLMKHRTPLVEKSR